MIKEMYDREISFSDIVMELRIDRKTVRNIIHSPIPPSKSKRKQRKSRLDPFNEYLQKLGEKQAEGWKWKETIGGSIVPKKGYLEPNGQGRGTNQIYANGNVSSKVYRRLQI